MATATLVQDGQVYLTRFFAGQAKGIRYQLAVETGGYVELTIEEVASLAVKLLACSISECEAQGGDVTEIRRLVAVVAGK
jgi:hypothetical protein